MVAIIPELVVVIRNQVRMIYDLAFAYRKEHALGKELLLHLLLSATGSGGGGLLLMHGQKVIVRRTSLRAIQRLVSILAGKITQRALKSALVRWVPIAGAAGMGLWVRHTTKRIGAHAIEIFERDIQYEDSGDHLGSNGGVVEADEVETAEPDEYLCERIRALIKLAHIDRSVAQEELEHLRVLIERVPLAPDAKAGLSAIAEDLNAHIDLDFETLRSRPDDALALVMDLIALAEIDGHFHKAEKMFIRDLALRLGLTAADADELIAAGLG